MALVKQFELPCSLKKEYEEAKAAGADLVGADNLAEKFKAVTSIASPCIATPDMMAVVGRLGKVLGPGLMPS